MSQRQPSTVDWATIVARQLQNLQCLKDQQEQLLQRIERGVDAPGTGKGTVIVALGPPRPPVLLDARIGVMSLYNPPWLM